MRITTISLFSALIFAISFGGIYRDDVKEEEYLALAQQKQFDCVGQIYSGTSWRCSCVLISDRFILTAAHIFIDSDIRHDTVHMNDQTVILYVPYNSHLTDVSKLYAVFKDHKVKVKSFTIYPNYLDSLNKGSCDIAIIELEQPITTISPARINKDFDELKSNVIGVGFGASGPANKPELIQSSMKKIAGENVVDSLTGYKLNGYETILSCDLDHPTRKDCNKMGSSVPRPLEYVTSGGDSGGGLFRQKDKRWELVGICCGRGVNIDQLNKSGYYGQIMDWTRVSAFADWISQQVKQ